MRTKRAKKVGRHTEGRGVSLPLELSDAVDQRIKSLHPWVRGFSSYVQALILHDLAHRTLQVEPIKKDWCAVEGSNLRPPPCQGGALPLS